ncbi:MAG: integrase, partial [Comamonas sp.]
LVSQYGRAMSKQMMRDAFEVARQAAAEKAEKDGDADLAQEIKAFWFYDLRAKAADDVADERGEVAASKQLGHASVQTTKRHYLRRGSKVNATK